MKKTVYIVPGMGETCNAVRYKNLSKALEEIGYTVVGVNPDWYKPVSDAVFKVPKHAVIIGFSMGAVIAYLSVKKNPCKKVIFASLSPIDTFTFKDFYSFLLSYMSKEKAEAITHDVLGIKVSLKSLKTPYITMAGEKEKDLTAQFLVPKTGHYMSKAYIKAIVGLLKN